jgi:hypothetical protein
VPLFDCEVEQYVHVADEAALAVTSDLTVCLVGHQGCDVTIVDSTPGPLNLVVQLQCKKDTKSNIHTCQQHMIVKAVFHNRMQTSF